MKKMISALALVLAASCGGSSSSNTVTLTTSAQISAYLEGKTMVMTGSDIPTSPNGYSQDLNLGSATQCYNTTTISVLSGTWNVTSKLGTLKSASDGGSATTCDRTTVSGTAMSSSTAIAFTNIQGNATCFDFSATYSGFGQEGRGSISADGKTVELEIFFAGQTTGATCEAGAVGSNTVMLKGVAFTGNAVQTYRVQ